MFGKSAWCLPILDVPACGVYLHKTRSSDTPIHTENSMDIGAKPDFDHDYCKELAKHMVHFSSLPNECKAYQDVASDLKRRETDTTHPSQIL